MKNNTSSKITLADLETIARSGTTSDIDYLMEMLNTDVEFLYCKMIDYALGLVISREGRVRIKHFLFNGNKIQRNYAALYFKRQGAAVVLDEAYQQGCIDKIQAFSK